MDLRQLVAMRKGMGGGPPMTPPDDSGAPGESPEKSALSIMVGMRPNAKGMAASDVECPNCGCTFDPANPDAYTGGDSAPPDADDMAPTAPEEDDA